MNLRPLGDRLVVLPIQGKNETESGIALPENRREAIVEAKVWEVGPLVNHEVKTGERIHRDDIIVYAPYVGHEYKYKGTTYVIIKRGDVIARKVEE